MAKSTTIKKLNIFDHLKHITGVQTPNYYVDLNEQGKKSWSNYMLLRLLSMNTDWVDIVAEFQPQTQELPPEIFYKFWIGIIPKGRHYSKYIKAKGADKYEGWLLDLFVIEFECSKKEAREYASILYSTYDGKLYISDLCKRYGIEKTQITKLKLKIKK